MSVSILRHLCKFVDEVASLLLQVVVLTMLKET
jgi:hypothetical protein